MSSLSAWSLTHTATYWPIASRHDWDGSAVYGPPIVVPCDYKMDTRTAMDSRGNEFVLRMTVYTESDIPIGSRVVLREEATPYPTDDAQEVRAVVRYADVFDGIADDFEVLT